MLGIDLFNDDSIEHIKEAIICINDKLLSECFFLLLISFSYYFNFYYYSSKRYFDAESFYIPFLDLFSKFLSSPVTRSFYFFWIILTMITF